VTEEQRLGLIEALAWICILVSVPAVAIPKYADVQRRDTAERVLNDVDVMRAAVFQFYSDSAYFPPDSGGAIPESLAAYLPGSFSRAREYGSLGYRNWAILPPPGADSTAKSNVVGVTVTTKDPKVALTAANLAPAMPRFTVESKPTFLFFGS
jgi:hypothetical protein